LSIVLGDHVPVIPFKEVVGKVGGVTPAQTTVIGLKVGVIKSSIKMKTTLSI
jgi:hypothetical protein